MSYKLVKNLTTVNYTKGNSGRKYIVIHYTGNKTDSALANANYFKSVNRGASAHYFVDKTSVYQVVSDGDTAWAVGKNYGSNNLFGKCTNKNSISIEMCSNDGKIHDDTYKNTVELTKKLMKKYNIPADITMYARKFVLDGMVGRVQIQVFGRNSKRIFQVNLLHHLPILPHHLPQRKKPSQLWQSQQLKMVQKEHR